MEKVGAHRVGNHTQMNCLMNRRKRRSRKGFAGYLASPEQGVGSSSVLQACLENREVFVYVNDAQTLTTHSCIGPSQ